MAAAAEILLGDNALPAVTGRVCPQETQCEEVCIRGNKGAPVAIGYLERYVADWARQQPDQLTPPSAPPPPARRWPSSAPARRDSPPPANWSAWPRRHHLRGPPQTRRRAGVRHPRVPPPKKIVAGGRAVAEQGVKIECNVVIGTHLHAARIAARVSTPCFIANGAGLPVFMNVPGENLKGVYSANEYLTRVNLMAAYLSPTPTRPCCAVSAWW